MKQIFFFLSFLAWHIGNCQHNVTGTFVDSLAKVKRVALYQFQKGNPNYINFAKVQNKQFSFAMDTLPSGYYRALYKNVSTGYVDFIYNKEAVNLQVHSQKGQTSVTYKSSRENQLLYAYNYNISRLQQKLDSIQMAYFRSPNANITFYKEVKHKIDGAQAYYENLAANDYCLGIIKASKRYNAPVPYTLPGNYIQAWQQHFLDAIDFSDPKLIDTPFLKSRVIDYVFYLHTSNDVTEQNRLQFMAIQKVMGLIKDATLKEVLLANIIKQIVNKENSNLLKQVLPLYKTLPLHKKVFVTDTQSMAKTMLGVIAPNIHINNKESLHNLSGYKTYVVLFWSSSCSHCAAELPKLYDWLKKHPNIAVLAVGLENKSDVSKWEIAKNNYPLWKNVLAKNKWEHPYANAYTVNATPAYFILDQEKRIIAKPKNMAMFKKAILKHVGVSSNARH